MSIISHIFLINNSVRKSLFDCLEISLFFLVFACAVRFLLELCASIKWYQIVSSFRIQWNATIIAKWFCVNKQIFSVAFRTIEIGHIGLPPCERRLAVSQTSNTRAQKKGVQNVSKHLPTQMWTRTQSRYGSNNKLNTKYLYVWHAQPNRYFSWHFFFSFQLECWPLSIAHRNISFV